MKNIFCALAFLCAVVMFGCGNKAQALPQDFADCHIPQLNMVWYQNPSVGTLMDSTTYLAGESNGVQYETKLKKLEIKKNSAVYLLEYSENGKAKSTLEVKFDFDMDKGSAFITKAEFVALGSGQKSTQTFDPNANLSPDAYMSKWGEMLGFFTESATYFIDVPAMLKK